MRFLYLILALLSIVAFVEGGKEKKNVCELPMRIGKTKGNFQRFYFSRNASKCLEFGYGGSGGNGNNFKTLKECNRKCICGQPKKVGDGLASIESWYFNQKKNTCIKFNFAGGNGNENNFMSKNECLIACGDMEEPSTGGKPSKGGKRSTTMKPTKGRKKSKGGKKSKGEKRSTTMKPSKGRKKSKGGKRSTTMKPSTGEEDVCTQPMEVGKGRARHPRWYYNGMECEKFYFKGGKGNGNNFMSKKKCRNACVNGNSNEGNTGEEDVCTLPKEVGDGKARHRRWYYNGKKCQRFNFGGGEGNGNNFMSKKECREACVDGNSNEGNPSTGEEDVCTLRKKEGKGRAKHRRWYYNGEVCKKFNFKGSKGNANNFKSEKDCKKACLKGEKVKGGKGQKGKGGKGKKGKGGGGN